jgi:flagellar assembly protein FliH
MSSSPSRAPIAPAVPRPGGSAPPDVLPFPYSEVGGAAGLNGFQQAEPGSASAGRGESAADATGAAQSKELGRQQGEREARAKFDEDLARERSAVAQAVADFSRERAAYYQQIEEEAVQLALSVARKVLHREAQVDPLLLMGIVRVALERIEGATQVTLAVHPERAAVWRSYLAERMDPGGLPQIVEDPAMALEQCELRTSMGTATLGVEVQLKEIEQGLMDLLAARPQENEKDKQKEQEKKKP